MRRDWLGIAGIQWNQELLREDIHGSKMLAFSAGKE